MDKLNSLLGFKNIISLILIGLVFYGVWKSNYYFAAFCLILIFAIWFFSEKGRKSFEIKVFNLKAKLKNLEENIKETDQLSNNKKEHLIELIKEINREMKLIETKYKIPYRFPPELRIKTNLKPRLKPVIQEFQKSLDGLENIKDSLISVWVKNRDFLYSKRKRNTTGLFFDYICLGLPNWHLHISKSYLEMKILLYRLKYENCILKDAPSEKIKEYKDELLGAANELKKLEMEKGIVD